MASTSTTAGGPERESTKTFQGTAPSPSTSGISSSPSLCLSSFDWVSSFIPWRAVQSSAPNRLQENEVMGAFEGTEPSASTSTSDHLRQNEIMGVFEGTEPSASASTSDRLRQNEVMGVFEGTEPSQSTSTRERLPQNEVMGVFEGTEPSASTSTSDCLPQNEVMGAFEGTEPSASISTRDRLPQNEVMGAFEGTEPSASTSTHDRIGENDIRGFKEIAPSAPTPALTLMQKPRYDVFINHRGPDVKHTLASSIYNILNNLKVTAFLDSEELEYGDFLPTTLEAAMRSASLHIAIFSENYAKSSWCLAELSIMLKTGAKIIPVFYHVEPTDLRWVGQGKGIYVKAFEEYEQKGRYSLVQLQEWKRALHVVSYYNGQIIKTHEDEMKLFKSIVSCVLKEIKNVPLVVAKHPVGLKEIVEDFEVNTLRSAHGNQIVQIVGIWGMGGSGKTTLAKELYNKISSSTERSSFVFDVRDAATKGLLHEKQKKLLNDLGVQGVAFDNIEEGIGALSRALRSVRVLIVLDDVENVEQLDALLPTKDSLDRGRLVIVTTRAYDVLKSWGISSIYKMRSLDPVHSEQLFCWHAFLQSFPQDGFEKLVEKFLKACQGLPLSLKVFGGQLYGESRKEYWESLLHNISKILSHDIKKKLKVSYDALNYEEKQVFLDIACFFIGEDSSMAIEVWNGLGWSGLYSWERLLNKCLVELDCYNCIRMHDHLRDLGREIANQQVPYRLWFPQQKIDVEKYEEKRIGIQGIIATSTQLQWFGYKGEQRFPGVIEITGEVDEFRVCCSHQKLMVNTNGGIWSLEPSLVGLKFLVISGDYFNQVMGEVAGELVWFRWFKMGQRKLPSGLSLKKLRVLELYEDDYEHHLEELWGETDGEAPVQLRELLISDCHKFNGFPNSIGRLNHLKKVVIIHGHSVTSLPDEFCRLQSLEHLVLYECKMLQSLPSNFGKLRNLRHLSLYGCSGLRMLPSNFGNLRNVRHLCLSGCGELKMLPVSCKNLMFLEYLNLEGCSQLTFTSEDLNILENMTKLECLSLSECEQLKELPRHITNQASLRKLYLNGTNLRELPVNIGQLSRLREMTIGSVLLTSLPTSLGDLSSLTDLSFFRCPNLECLPDSLGALSSLTSLSIQACPKLECLPNFLGALSSLTTLSIQGCRKMQCLPDSLGDLSSLTNLLICDCPKIECLPDSLGRLNLLKRLRIFMLGVKSLPNSVGQLNNLQKLDILFCPISELDFAFSNLKSLLLQKIEVCRISISEECCPHLESLELHDNHHLKEIEALPRTVESVWWTDCEMLKKIPSFARLTSLRKIELEACYRIEKIEGLENCTRLESLEVDTHWEVPGIESLEHMEKLYNVNLRANKGSAIERCIQTIEKWPDELQVCMRAVPDASKLVDSLLSPNLMVIDSFANQKLQSTPKWVLNCSSNGDAFMLCFIINCVSSEMTVDLSSRTNGIHLTKVEKGRWVSVFTQRCQSPNFFSEEVSLECSGGECEEEDEVEKGLVLRGEEQTLVEAFRGLLSLL